MATKKIIAPKPSKDPGRPVSRPMAVESTNVNWGKTLTKPEWVRLMKKLEKKKKDREMSKLSDTLQRALDKKKGITHVDGKDATAKDTKTKRVKTAPPAGKKPAIRPAGRGR